MQHAYQIISMCKTAVQFFWLSYCRRNPEAQARDLKISNPKSHDLVPTKRAVGREKEPCLDAVDLVAQWQEGGRAGEADGKCQSKTGWFLEEKHGCTCCIINIDKRTCWNINEYYCILFVISYINNISGCLAAHLGQAFALQVPLERGSASTKAVG